MFPSMDPWEVALWIVAAWLAVVSLVRLMTYHRDRLVARLHDQLRWERRQQAEMILAAAPARPPDVTRPATIRPLSSR